MFTQEQERRVQEIVKTAMQPVIAETVKQTLIQLGIDNSDPLEMQRDFQHLRDWRRSVEDLKRKSLLTMIGIVVTGAVGLLLVGLREWFRTG